MPLVRDICPLKLHLEKGPIKYGAQNLDFKHTKINSKLQIDIIHLIDIITIVYNAPFHEFFTRIFQVLREHEDKDCDEEDRKEDNETDEEHMEPVQWYGLHGQDL